MKPVDNWEELFAARRKYGTNIEIPKTKRFKDFLELERSRTVGWSSYVTVEWPTYVFRYEYTGWRKYLHFVCYHIKSAYLKLGGKNE